MKIIPASLLFSKKSMKGAKYPYWSNKKAIILIIFVSILWFLYGAVSDDKSEPNTSSISAKVIVFVPSL